MNKTGHIICEMMVILCFFPLFIKLLFKSKITLAIMLLYEYQNGCGSLQQHSWSILQNWLIHKAL